jgi:hypothetical protein
MHLTRIYWIGVRCQWVDVDADADVDTMDGFRGTRVFVWPGGDVDVVTS